MVLENYMAEDDIYGNKKRYDYFVAHIDSLPERHKMGRSWKYYCKSSVNLQYFRNLIPYFEARDGSYIRRYRVFQVLKFVTFVIEKDLAVCDRDDINKVIAAGHVVNKTVKSKEDLIRDVKYLWKILFPEKDEYDRIDETLIPYPVRHLKPSIDKSKQKLRNDRLTWEEFQRILNFFSGDIRLQAYIMLAMESLGRPQEILYTRIRNYEFYDTFAKIWISEHGKEGTGFLQSIDSFPYIVEWYNKHPFKNNPDAFFFINQGNRNLYKQMTNGNVNKHLKHACKSLGIDKNVTCYSLKRNGVTFCRQRGDSDLQIQRKARWTSTKQLRIYDMSNQEDALQIELEKRGLVAKKTTELNSAVKQCMFCSYKNGFTAEFCTNCKRPLDRKKIEEMTQAHGQMVNNELLQRLARMEKLFEGGVRH